MIGDSDTTTQSHITLTFSSTASFRFRHVNSQMAMMAAKAMPAISIM